MQRSMEMEMGMLWGSSVGEGCWQMGYLLHVK